MHRVILLIVICLSVSGQVATAAVSDQEFAQLRADFAALAARLNALEAENAELREATESMVTEAAVAEQQVAVVAKPSDAETWADRIKIKGDFRYRYQNEDFETASDERNRQRIRARPAIIAKIPGNVELGFGMATGSDDPVSTNQTLGGGGSSKDIKLDLAYFDWEGLEGLHLRGGKFKNPLRRAGGHELLWDGDWRPEGFTVLYDKGRFFGSVLGTWAESDSRRDDEFSYGLQGGVRAELGGATFTIGGGYYDIDAAGRECFFDADDCAGNSTNPDGTYRFDFQEIEAFAEAEFELGGFPSAAFLNYVQNTDADAFDTGWAAGVTFGKAKKAGSWQVGYTYQDLEADAVLGVLTNSDFAGGGTDAEGHVLKGAYSLTDRVKLKLAYFLTERKDSNGVENGGVAYDADTLQLDLEFKYD
jgi:hypothetical protein